MGITIEKKNKKRICPLTFNFEVGLETRGQYCIQEQCAFWLTLQRRCAVLAIAEYFAYSNQLRKYKPI